PKRTQNPPALNPRGVESRFRQQIQDEGLDREVMPFVFGSGLQLAGVCLQRGGRGSDWDGAALLPIRLAPRRLASADRVAGVMDRYRSHAEYSVPQSLAAAARAVRTENPRSFRC